MQAKTSPHMAKAGQACSLSTNGKGRGGKQSHRKDLMVPCHCLGQLLLQLPLPRSLPWLLLSSDLYTQGLSFLTLWEAFQSFCCAAELRQMRGVCQALQLAQEEQCLYRQRKGQLPFLASLS